MRATVEIKALKAALAKIVQVIGRGNRRWTVPILNCVRMEVRGSVLELRATNLDIEITVSVPASAAIAGAICAPVRIESLIRLLPSDQMIAIRSAEGNRVVFEMPDGMAAFIGLPPEEWPDLFRWAERQFFEHPGDPKQIADIFARVTPFISTEETRYYLNGIYIEQTAESQRFTATNGHTLATIDVPLSAPLPSTSFILPRETVAVFRKVFSDDRITIRVEACDRPSWVRFATDEVIVDTKLIDGTFPDYRRVIPDMEKASAQYAFDADKAINACRRAMSFGQDNQSSVLIVEQADGRVAMTRSNIEMGEQVYCLPARRVGGEASGLQLRANLKYLIPAFAAHAGDEVKFHAFDSGHPHVWRSAHCTSMVMPMRTDCKPVPLPEGAAA